MIAIACALTPRLIIADEPTTALDVTVQAQVLELLFTLQAQSGAAVLFITHDLGVVAEIADRVVVMQAGRIVEEGAVGQIYAQPRDPYTQALLAAVPDGTRRAIRRGGWDAGQARRLPDERRHPARGRGVQGIRAGTQPAGPADARAAGRARRQPVDRARRHAGAGRRIGLGQEHAGPLHLRPTSGSVELAGHDVQRLSGAALLAFRRQVQTIFQDPYSSLNPRRTVGDAIMDGMVIHKLCGAEERQARMLALLSRVGLQPDHARRYPHQFSGGQRQRIAIARALALEPRFIVADEAVSALDVSVKAQVLDLLADLQAEHGLTYLFISHDLGVVRHFADRVAVMAAGEIVEEGDCDQIFESPAQAYTRQLIAAVPRPDPARRSLRRGDAARAGAVFPAGRGWGPAKRGVKKGRDRRRGLKFWFRPAVSRREASGGGSWQPWPLACRNCRHDYDFLGLPADGHRAPDAVAGAVARENGQPAGRSAAAVHHGDAGWQAGASDLYPRQHRGDGAVRRHLAARSQRRDLRDDGDQWPQFSQQPFQWAGRRRAEPLPHGRRQLLAILILPSAATEGVSASALSSQLRARAPVCRCAS